MTRTGGRLAAFFVIDDSRSVPRAVHCSPTRDDVQRMTIRRFIIFFCCIFTLPTLGCDGPKQRPFASIDEVLKTNGRYAEYELLETFGAAESPFYRSKYLDLVLNSGARKKGVRFSERGIAQRQDLSEYDQEILVSFLKDSSDNACILVLGRKPKIQD